MEVKPDKKDSKVIVCKSFQLSELLADCGATLIAVKSDTIDPKRVIWIYKKSYKAQRCFDEYLAKRKAEKHK